MLPIQIGLRYGWRKLWVPFLLCNVSLLEFDCCSFYLHSIRGCSQSLRFIDGEVGTTESDISNVCKNLKEAANILYNLDIPMGSRNLKIFLINGSMHSKMNTK